jgi:predicted RNase H-like HicB family nuclease
MKYKVVLSKNEDGYAVHCPALRGCWSQGATEDEALENIRSAIQEYLLAVEDLTAGQEVREVEVSVG